MSRFFLGLALWALLLALAACGGDSKGTDPKDAELAEMVDTVVSTFEDLTVCTDKREGSTAYVEDEKKAYVCESKRWTANDSLTELILDKDSDSAEGTEPGEMADTVVSVFDDLLACTKNREGATAYVEDEDTAYVCKKGLWVVDDSLTKAIQRMNEKTSSNSQNNKSSSSFQQGSVFPVDNTLATPCKTESEDNCEYDTLRDSRDFETYKIVKIGEQWWMAENLRYWGYSGIGYVYQTVGPVVSGQAPMVQSMGLYTRAICDDRETYGCSYFFNAVMDSAGNGNGKGCGYQGCFPSGIVRGICPEGWHLPDTSEWNALFAAVGGEKTAGIMLKSTSGREKGNGTDAYGFNAIPAPYCKIVYEVSNNIGDYKPKCFDAYNSDFWSYSLDGGCYHVGFDGDRSRIYAGCYGTGDIRDSRYSYYVRCIKGSDTVSTQSAIQIQVCSLTDNRDGQTYKTVKIGEQWWMAENLNYETEAGSYCYNDSAEYCEKYGRLYTWAMDVCPEGWHLPDTTEWKALFDAVGGQATAGTILKSTEGWPYNGYRDTYSFSALPAGFRNNFGNFYNEGDYANFWSSTERRSNDAFDVELHYTRGDAYLTYDDKYRGFSVRCVKDSALSYPQSACRSLVSSSSIHSSTTSSSSSVASSSSVNSSTTSSSSSAASSSSIKSSATSSSSVAPVSSSSSSTVSPTYSTLTDDRDGQTYKTVKIGEQWWMAENLNYAYTGVPFKYVLSTDSNLVYYSDSTSWCYDNDAANCAKYGRLYTWAAAMDSVGTWSTNSKGCGYGTACSPTYPVRGICPEGWHLPTNAEFETLFTAVGGQSTAGKMLKSTSGWNSSGNGTGAYSFSALPAGYRNDYGDYNYEGNFTFFWSSTESNSNGAYFMYLYCNYDYADLSYINKGYGFSVRCLKD